MMHMRTCPTMHDILPQQQCHAHCKINLLKARRRFVHHTNSGASHQFWCRAREVLLPACVFVTSCNMWMCVGGASVSRPPVCDRWNYSYASIHRSASALTTNVRLRGMTVAPTQRESNRATNYALPQSHSLLANRNHRSIH